MVLTLHVNYSFMYSLQFAVSSNLFREAIKVGSLWRERRDKEAQRV